jgi:hypothetical protein
MCKALGSVLSTTHTKREETEIKNFLDGIILRIIA